MLVHAEAVVGHVCGRGDDEPLAVQVGLGHPQGEALAEAPVVGQRRGPPEGQERRPVDLVVSYPVLHGELAGGELEDLPCAAQVPGDHEDVARASVGELDREGVVGAVLAIEDHAFTEPAAGTYRAHEVGEGGEERSAEIQLRPFAVDERVDVGRVRAVGGAAANVGTIGGIEHGDVTGVIWLVAVLCEEAGPRLEQEGRAPV